LTGSWFDRTQELAARRRGESYDRLTDATKEALVFAPLPCWGHGGTLFGYFLLSAEL
jgi:hypothetical protein